MNHSSEEFDNLPEWIRNKVAEPNNAVASDNPQAREVEVEELEDMPF